MLIHLMTSDYEISADNSGCCSDCTHPTKSCSGSCQECLNEVHFAAADDKRKKYDCPRLVGSYWNKYGVKYYQNIKAACNNINFLQYPYLSVLSLGCGASPDLMAFEEIADGKMLKYNGIDREKCWSDIQKSIIDYSLSVANMTVRYEERDIFESTENPPTEIYNIIVLQFLISTLWNEGKRDSDIIHLFRTIVDTAVMRWNDSDMDSPFLFILNDVDSINEGRGCFYHLIDVLEERGYTGSAYAYSAHRMKSDLGEERWSIRKNMADFGNIRYVYSDHISNNSATLMVEVLKNDYQRKPQNGYTVILL